MKRASGWIDRQKDGQCKYYMSPKVPLGGIKWFFPIKIYVVGTKNGLSIVRVRIAAISINSYETE